MPQTTNILPGDDAAAVARAVRVLRGGGCIGLPTETVYGLACDALSAAAAANVFAVKERPSFDPLIVHTRDLAHAEQLAVFDDTARALAERFWPGPLTLVLPRRHDADTGRPVVPDLVTAGLGRVGLRVPAHPVAQRILAESGLALAAPSANRFGSISPTTARHVADELAGRIEVVLDGGACDRGVESTVVTTGPAVDRDGGAPVVTVLRLGATPVEALPGVTVEVAPPTSRPVDADAARPAPGMTDRHYAPSTALYLVTEDKLTPDEQGIDPTPTEATSGGWGLIALGDVARFGDGFAQARSLSEAGDLTEAAARLFGVMRELDALGLGGIVAVAVPDTGLGRAINDRLRRASVRARE